jgi:subtilase family protein/type IX secretion system substrate protein
MRKLYRVLMALPLISLSINVCFAQNTQTSVEQVTERFENIRQFEQSKFGKEFYLLITFKDLPGKAEITRLAQNNIKLLEYHSNYTYLASIPEDIDPSVIKSFNISSVCETPKASKLDDRLLSKDYPEWTTEENGKVDVALIFHEKTDQETIQRFLEDNNITILEDNHRGHTTIVARVLEEKIELIAASPLISFIDVKQEPVQILNHEVRIGQKVNVLNSALAGGYNLQGNGVTVGVGDGGELGDHIDFGGRVINEASGTYSSFGDHGDHVSGIIGGAGNLNPRHKGMAPKCNIVTQKTSQITYNIENYFSDYNVVLTNNSYGTTFNCTTNGSYNYSAQTLDWQLREFPEVLHVFAAGNSGGGTCDPYPTGYRSVLRYYQSAKNVLTVGMAEENRTIAVSSSRGPVLDGRLKPEIIGIGRNVISTSREYDYSTKGGTSMSSPGVVGTLALLVEKYRIENNGQNPPGALVKAIACNTADDLGNPGPDFIHGFGLINGRRAAEVIEQNQYHTDELENGEIKAHAINVPQGIKQVKFMLYWHDKEAEIYPDKALVNDLDITVIAPNGEIIQPWVLDPSPTGVSENAVRGVDSRNNIEQVTIDNPSVGVYTVLVKGEEIAFGPQQFFTTYDLIREEIILTHPFGGESFAPDEFELISWDADITNTNTFRLEYSLDGGNLWLEIAPAVAADIRSYKWTVPQVYTPDAKIRVSKNGTNISSENETFFHIMDIPEGLVATPTCEQKMILDWDDCDYSQSYEVFMYNGESMVSIGVTDETSFVVEEPMNLGEMYWFSLRAIGIDGNKSRRVIAVSGIPEDIEICPWDDNPLVEAVGARLLGRDETSLSLTDEETVTMLVKNIGSNDLNNFEMYYSVNGGIPVQESFSGLIESGESLLIEFNTKADFSEVGQYSIDVWVEISGNNYNYADSLLSSLYANQISNYPVLLPFAETFNSASSEVYSEDVLGLDGCVKWDFDSNGFGELEIEQGVEMILRPTVVANGTPILNNAILTMNMSQYANMEKELILNFDYRTATDYVVNSYEIYDNAVYIRGSDTDEWVLLYTLNKNSTEWTAVQSLDVTQLLIENDQTLSTSFQIRFSNNNNLPIAFTDILLEEKDESTIDAADIFSEFTAEQFGEDVILKWTPIEDTGSYFEIEVIDNYNNEEDFDVIGTVLAESTTTEPFFYTFTDNEPGKKGRRYYRIKQISADGSITFSPVLSVLINQEEITGVFPNPFTDKINIFYTAQDDKSIEILISNQNGSLIQANAVDVNPGEDVISIQLNENLPAGMYLLKVIDGMKTTCHKVVKQ